MRILILMVACMVAMTTSAQKKQKIKGDKNVVDIYKNLDPFSQIEVTDDLEVFIMQTSSNGYHVKTDSNLVDIIKLDVIDGVLKIYTTHKIVSSKKMEIYVTFQDLERIHINQNAQVEGQNKFELLDFTLNCMENATFDLDINTTDFFVQMDDSSRGELQIKSTNAKAILNDKARLEGIISIDNMELTINKSAYAKLEGNVENLNLMASGSADLKGKDLKVTEAELNISNSSEVYLYVSKHLSIYARGKSILHIFGSPEISVKGLSDKSQILKK
ncbi:head GIN domain-containing protein [Bizionia hallyeonensis]|uniref:Head GIN domain-containing protein n=1 Tax=Bizionia hallyeonensis TaxID=1123757 RepID=A0ABW0C0N9_9FLAO